jgi:peptidoglycan/xylan/chitin deacetylase (PgdA/CDA1 family)
VGTREWGVNDVTPGRFRRQLELALRAGYRFVPEIKIASGNGAQNELALTFDDGLDSVATNAAPILADLDIPWTLFIVTEWADGLHGWGEGVLLSWNQVERLTTQGATIGSHSLSHRNFARLTQEEMAAELIESRRIIESRVGIRTDTFAIPFGQAKDWNATAQRLAQEAGYERVYAQTADRRAKGTIARTFITRFDNEKIFGAALSGAFDRWEEWV